MSEPVLKMFLPLCPAKIELDMETSIRSVWCIQAFRQEKVKPSKSTKYAETDN